MVTRDEIYGTLHPKRWKCAHEIKEELDTVETSSLETSLFAEFVQQQPEVLLPTIEKYLTAFVDGKVAEYRKRTQNNEQILSCGLQLKELEYRLLPQEIKLRTDAEEGKSGEYRSVA